MARQSCHPSRRSCSARQGRCDMAEPAPIPWSDGALRGNKYIFQTPGDALPLHVHDDANAHLTVVMGGMVRVAGADNAWSMDLSPGEIVSFVPNQPHSITALASNTSILNIIKGRTA